VTGRLQLTLVALSLSLLVSACGSPSTKQTTATDTASPQASWRLADLEHPGRSQSLVKLFNTSSGTARLILLVSPT